MECGKSVQTTTYTNKPGAGVLLQYCCAILCRCWTVSGRRILKTLHYCRKCLRSLPVVRSAVLAAGRDLLRQDIIVGEMMSEGMPVVEVMNISKKFGGTQALKDVSIAFYPGEFHAIMGENGAGKSTLMNIIGGVYKQDNGEIIINGEQVDIDSPHESQRLGIGFVHQEIALCTHVSVIENIILGMEDKHHMLKKNFGKELLDKTLGLFNTSIDPLEKVANLTTSYQQIVEIAKALAADSKLIIFDEPTSSLTEAETETLFKVIKHLKSEGIAIVYISHRMNEVFTYSDKVSVLRDGCIIDTLRTADTREDIVVRKMVGRELSKAYPPKAGEKLAGAKEILRVEGLSSEDGGFSDISFSLHENEIFGIAGLVGAGRSEVVKTICGLIRKDSGTITHLGENIEFKNYQQAIDHGIVYLTEDRKVEGLFLDYSIAMNMSALDLSNISSRTILNKKAERRESGRYIKKLSVRCRGPEQKVGSLSGGNQQKVLLSKLLAVKPRIIILDEPTRGIDIGAKLEIHHLIRELANSGVGVIVISSELPEVIGSCDRVMVMYEGRQSGFLQSDELSEEAIIHLASGLEWNEKTEK